MIKAIAILLIVFGAMGLCAMGVAVCTRPTDEEIYSRIRNRGTGDENVLSWALGETTVNRATIRIQDHLIYKDIYSAIDGEHIGTAYFGTINLD